MLPEPVMRHASDEDLLIDFYDEGTAADRSRVRAHLEQCAECRALDDELRAVLTAVETTPITEPPSGFEREMWRRIEPLLPIERRRRAGWYPRLAFAASMVLLVIGAFAAGRIWDRPTVDRLERVADDAAITERLLRAEVEDHLERSQRVLVELVNADVERAGLIPGERARAADLVAAGRLYRRSVEEQGDSGTRSLLEDLERVLVEVANGPIDTGPDDLARLRQRIADQDLVFRLRVVAAEMRARDARERTAW